MTVEKPEEMMDSMKEARGPKRNKTWEYEGFSAGEGKTEIIL